MKNLLEVSKCLSFRVLEFVSCSLGNWPIRHRTMEIQLNNNILPGGGRRGKRGDRSQTVGLGYSLDACWEIWLPAAALWRIKTLERKILHEIFKAGMMTHFSLQRALTQNLDSCWFCFLSNIILAEQIAEHCTSFFTSFLRICLILHMHADELQCCKSKRSNRLVPQRFPLYFLLKWQ